MKSILKKIADKLGLEIKRGVNSDQTRFKKLLSFNKIDLILDVGANTGQYARFLRRYGYRGKIISFEPLSTAYSILLEQSKNDPAWIIAPRLAIGDMDGEIQIHVSANSVSSSILEMKNAHKEAAPDSCYSGTESVELRRLDSLLDDKIFTLTKSSFLKIDVQGYEDRVLKGGTELLKQVKGIQVELSTTPLYQGQILFDQLIEIIQSHGFELFGLIPGFIDIKSGRMLQFDGIFFKENSSNKKY